MVVGARADTASQVGEAAVASREAGVASRVEAVVASLEVVAVIASQAALAHAVSRAAVDFQAAGAVIPTDEAIPKAVLFGAVSEADTIAVADIIGVATIMAATMARPCLLASTELPMLMATQIPITMTPVMLMIPVTTALRHKAITALPLLATMLR